MSGRLLGLPDDGKRWRPSVAGAFDDLISWGFILLVRIVEAEGVRHALGMMKLAAN